jgi:protein gp37
MGERTAISWTDHTLNPWIGCAKIDPACANCYAAEATPTRVHRSRGLELWGKRAARHETRSWEADARRWNREAQRLGLHQRVFCASLSDVFENRRDLDPLRVRLASLIRETPFLIWQLLTKRPESVRPLLRIALETADPETRHMLASWLGGYPPANVWLGTTVGHMAGACVRLPTLTDLPAKVRFVSYEPALEFVNFAPWLSRIQWLIIGGESGPHARPFSLDWARDVIEQCRRAGVAPFVKQLGSVWARAYGAQHPHGADPSEWPEMLRVQEFPA